MRSVVVVLGSYFARIHGAGSISTSVCFFAELTGGSPNTAEVCALLMRYGADAQARDIVGRVPADLLPVHTTPPSSPQAEVSLRKTTITRIEARNSEFEQFCSYYVNIMNFSLVRCETR